ncbi:follistatin-A-like [Belonocnema kinseyi]|uniref:follistatin-A-like n=1 Tax=Belonocnema kinseyi TaxID=2817044 RepID=UPI00143DA052|nr:follistatin-A-like [Belonocnema kinseyi]
MRRQFTFAFSISVTTLLLATVAAPVTENTLEVKSVQKDSCQQPSPFIDTCLIPCDTTGTEPVCGNDGKTYTSEKELLCYQTCQNIDLKVDYEGECECEILCDQCQDNPICEILNGNTYTCPINKITCQQVCGKKINIDYHGNCNVAEQSYNLPVSRV